MEKNNKYKLSVIVLSLGLTIAIILLSILYNDNMNLENQVLKREKLIKKTVVKDALLSKQKTKSDSIIERYISDCGIMIDNKKVSTEELLSYLYIQNQQINDLNNSNNDLNDSLRIYKSFIDLSKRNLKVDYSVKKEKNKFVSSITLPNNDSLRIYKKLYELVKRDYGIVYNFEDKNDKTIISKNYTKVDSALYLYKYYKFALGGDSLGNVTVQLPTEKEIKRVNKQKKRK